MTMYKDLYWCSTFAIYHNRSVARIVTVFDVLIFGITADGIGFFYDCGFVTRVTPVGD